MTEGDGGGQVSDLIKVSHVTLQVMVVDKFLFYVPYDSAGDGGGQVSDLIYPM